MMKIPAHKLTSHDGQLVNEGFDFNPDPMSDFAQKQARHTPDDLPVWSIPRRWDACTAQYVAAGALLARSEKVADNQRGALSGELRVLVGRVLLAHAEYLAECARQGVIPEYKFL